MTDPKANQPPPPTPYAPYAPPAWRRPLDLPIRWVLVSVVLVYRATLGPWLMGGQCRFHPTCSQYMLDAIARYGPYRGAWRGLKRIARCHPWGGSGYDPA